MSMQVKRMMIDSIQFELAGIRDFLVVDISRVSAVSVNRIRMSLADQQIHLKFVRNAVVSRALVDLGFDCAAQVLVGPSALVFGDPDISTMSKEISKCAEAHKGFEIKAGVAGGRIVTRADIDVLIKSPDRMELLSQLSAQLIAPSRNLASTISRLYGSIASQVERLSSR